MKGRLQFVLLLVGAISIVSVAVGIIAGWLIWDIFRLFQTSSNAALVRALGDRLVWRSWITLGALVGVLIATSLGVSLWAYRRIVSPYWRILETFSLMARTRLSELPFDDFSRDEQQLLYRYHQTLIRDYERLKSLEGIQGWKEGAQLLLHEIKNPMTPLKLSAESIAISGQASKETIRSILTAIKDLETILSSFKELSHIEFKELEPVSLVDFWSDTMAACEQLFPSLVIVGNPPPITLLSESTLLRMVVINLIRNGIEACPDFYVEFRSERPEFIYFVSPGQHVDDPGPLFKPGFSTKGEGRGYGLFICSQICRYLGHDIRMVNQDHGVEFMVGWGDQI